MAHIRYRPDIDGLRALAVLPVVAFHVGFNLFRGGFVGVDIFFVISGYLIGRGIVEDLEAGRFSVAGFYERRFRRILPALIVMLAATTAACCVLLFPHLLTDYAKSLIAAVASVSNIFFWQSSGYFAPAADSEPLLHTWSLAVEEQYYLLMPIILMLTFRFARRQLLAVIWTIAAVSFAISAFGVFSAPTATFYLLHTRAWELMAGLLAYLTPLPFLRRRGFREAIGWASLSVIAACVLIYKGRWPFPGAAALPPVLAATALIAVGGNGGSRANSLLARRPFVWVGLISYSLYLWHWPLIVLYRVGLLGKTATALPKLALIALALALAWLSWRFVERPFRTARHWRRGPIFAGAALASGVLTLAAGGIVLARGLPQRYAGSVRGVLAAMDYSSDAAFREGTCFFEGTTGPFDYDIARCTASTPGRPNVLLVGDSQAAHLYYGLDTIFAGSNIWQLTGAGCRPTLDDALDTKPRCLKLHHAIVSVLAQRRPDLIIVAGHWYQGDLPTLEAWVAQMTAMGNHILISGSVPDYNLPLPALLAYDAIHGTHNTPAHLRSDLPVIDARLADLAERRGARYVSMADALCDPAKGGRRGSCRTMAADGWPMFFDSGHLTRQGSQIVARALIGRDPALRTR